MTASSECDTLRVLHLPPYLTDEKRDELFKKYGAIKTKTIRQSEKYTTTFVKFASNEIAKKIFLQLHQLEVKGQYLSIEFAKKSIDYEVSQGDYNNDEINKGEKKEDNVNKAHFQAFIRKLNSWTTNYAFSQPPPPNISYKYPLPTTSTLIRIAIQLIKEPAFYTQVLHLMNKMNLPPPFEELDTEFPALREAYDVQKYKDIFSQFFNTRETINNNDSTEDNKDDENEEEEEEESEIECEEDEKIKTYIIPEKRKLLQSKKRLKRPKFINPVKQVSITSGQKQLSVSEMFESGPCQQKNLKIDLKSVDKLVEQSLDVNSTSVAHEDGGFGLMFPADKKEPETSEKSSEYISSEELAANRLSQNDQKILDVFKNYHPGVPSCRLYIKNLSKQVEENDLYYIYKRYVNTSLDNNSESKFVRLMQKGRMAGQAFVTFQNMGQAQLALNETNGFILKDKPMVVEFARSAKS